MNKFITKIVGAALGLTMAIGVGVAVGINQGDSREVRATETSFVPSDFSGQGTSGTGSNISATKDGITFSCNKGYGTTQVRCYSGGKITISASSDNITDISFTFSSSSNTGGLEDSYSDLAQKTWTFDLTSQARITNCTVTHAKPVLPKGVVVTGVESEGLYLKNESYDIGYEVTGFDDEPTITNVVWTVTSGAGSVSNGKWTTGSSAMENVTLRVDLKANGTDYHADVTTKIDAVTAFKKNNPKTKFSTDEVFTVGNAFNVEYTYATAGTVPESDAGITYRLENDGGTKIKDVVYNSTKFTTDDSGKYIDATYKGVNLSQRYSITVTEVFDNTVGAYYLVTDESELNNGDHVTLYGYYKKDQTVSTFVPTAFANKNVSAHEISLDNGAIDGKQDFKVVDFVLEDTSSSLSGSYAFCVSNVPEYLNKYLYAANAGENQLKTQADIDKNARFVITINDSTHIASIVATESSNRNKMGANYNNALRMFNCYTNLVDNNSLYLYKWVSNADKVQEFVDEKMHMDYDAGGKKGSEGGTGLCTTYYPLAKTAFNNLTASQRELFCDSEGSYADAYERLTEWARINGDSINGSHQLVSGAKVVGVPFDNKETNTAILVIVIASSVSLLAVSGYFVIRRRREN